MDLKEEQKTKDEYVQDLYIVHTDHLKDLSIKKKNKHKKFEYGHNKELDIVIISKDGTLGEIYEIQGLKIGLPLASNVDRKHNRWIRKPSPEIIKKIQSTEHYKKLRPEMDPKVVDELDSYSDQEWDRREDGYWFQNDGVDTYITGSHYFFIQWSKIDTDSGFPEYRDPNRIFYYFWEACKADRRCYGMCYLKNRRSGFSFMASSETINQASQTRDALFGVVSKTGADAKSMFTGKIVPVSYNLPYFFAPMLAGMDKQKTEINYSKPAEKISKKKMTIFDEDIIPEGLNTIVNWRNTKDNSYDGERLKMLVGDEIGKWLKPENVLNFWIVAQTCLRLGRKIVGKAMMGSTCNPLDKGGEEFKELYEKSDLRFNERDRTGRTPGGMYSLFIPAEWNMEGVL